MTIYGKNTAQIAKTGAVTLRCNTRPDTELMQQLSDGDIDSLGELYLRYGKLVSHAVIAAYPGFTTDAVEDTCHDVFLAIAHAAPRYREQGKLKSWIYSVAVRTAKKRARSRFVRDRLLRSLKGLPVAVSPPRSVPEMVSTSRFDLDRAFRSLTATQRQVILLFEMEGLSGEEIAEMLDIKLNTVWSHLRRARERMMNALDHQDTPPQGGRR